MRSPRLSRALMCGLRLGASPVYSSGRVLRATSNPGQSLSFPPKGTIYKWEKQAPKMEKKNFSYSSFRPLLASLNPPY